jgi:hypothetical protein
MPEPDTVPVPVGAVEDARQILLALAEHYPTVARRIEAALCPDDDHAGQGLILDTIAALDRALGD